MPVLKVMFSHPTSPANLGDVEDFSPENQGLGKFFKHFLNAEGILAKDRS
ncbi:hypothetical protein D082_05620 [Synechocystis sp. PCC 6714]|nr:hypothetical protein D082_05620 [Synechocystis sp. PCC 6714]